MTGSQRRLPPTILKIPRTSHPGTPSGPSIMPSAVPHSTISSRPCSSRSPASTGPWSSTRTDACYLRRDLADAPDTLELVRSVQGARTLAALAASQHGPVLKVSEDGYLTMFLKGRRVWEL